MAGNGANRANPSASCAANAVFNDDTVPEQSFANAGGAFLVYDMGAILLAKVLHGA